MNGIGNWFRKLGQNMKQGVRRFMTGRYGMDRLNSVFLWVSVVIALVALFLPGMFALFATLLSYILMGWAVFRALSRNTYKRYRENRRFLLFFDRMRGREHKYFNCPRCSQPVRVPKGKGKISITCPKCKEKFIRKT